MSSSSIHTNHIQRRVIRVLLIVAAIIAMVGIPLMVFDEQRLDIAHRLGLAPGVEAELLVSGDEGAVLIVIPLGEHDGIGREQYAYQAMYIARPTGDGMALSAIESDAVVNIPLVSLDFIAADSDGAHILFRGPSAGSTMGEQAVVLDTAANEIELLPEGEQEPDLPGDWETQTWQKVTGPCDRVSPGYIFIACFNRADTASYLAGDWQVDVQLYGDFGVSEPVYRGMGFLPMIGFAHDDTWLYFQNETGIRRIEVPESLREHHPAATPDGTVPNP